MIPDYYLLSFPRNAGEPSPADLSEMLLLGMTRAQTLARELVIVLLTGPWKKAWQYLVLAGKNALQAMGRRGDDAPRFTQ